jgi:hypothetical protein
MSRHSMLQISLDDAGRLCVSSACGTFLSAWQRRESGANFITRSLWLLAGTEN